MTICPCCGSQIESNLYHKECSDCGARAVGPPLARPERELPSYGPALAIFASGTLLTIAFTISTLIALFERKSFSFSFWEIVAAGETAAWRLKWFLLPLALLSIWAGVKVCRKIRREQARFIGLSAARIGLATSLFVAASIALLIGVTIPERLRQRELALKSAEMVQVYRIDRVLYAYKAQYETLPATPADLLKLPDADGTIKEVVEILDSGSYAPAANIAAVPASSVKGRVRRISALRMRPISTRVANADMDAPEGLSLTNYELVLPGRDETLGTDDDVKIRDGVIVDSSQTSKQSLIDTSTGKASSSR